MSINDYEIQNYVLAIVSNLPIPTDFYTRDSEETIAKCASIITDEFEELRRRKKEGTNDKS